MTSPRNRKTALLDRALACQQKGDLVGAEAGFRAALAEDPEHPDALLLLGDLLRRTKRAGQGLELIEQALGQAAKRNRSPDPSWRLALVLAQRDSGDLAGATRGVEQLLAAQPGNKTLRQIRADLLQRTGRHEEAVAEFRKLVGPGPPTVPVIVGLATSLEAKGRHADAFEIYARAAFIAARQWQFAEGAGQLLRKGLDADAAISVFRRQGRWKEKGLAILLTLLDVLPVRDFAPEAERLAVSLLREESDNPSVLVGLGFIRSIRGDRESAIRLARDALARDPWHRGALVLLAEVESGERSHELLERIEKTLNGTDGRDISNAGIRFAAGRLCDKLGRHVDAFEHFRLANADRKEILRRRGTVHDRSSVEQFVDQLIECFQPGSLEGPTGSDSEVPIFIVGMARSGTTLTEQVLASHPLVAGAGELPDVGRIVQHLRSRFGYPGQLPPGLLQDAARRYLQRIREIGQGLPRVVDKMPGNLLHLGLIVRMFPNARIVHCRRDPMDTCISCFTQDFHFSGDAWTCDLEDIGHQYCQYLRMMTHWRQVLPPGTMLEIDYEDTVDDLERQARRLVEFVGLEWNDACLGFHKMERDVLTPSRHQVRQPIYKTSVGRWKRYGPGVEPLVQSLSACGAGPKDD